MYYPVINPYSLLPANTHWGIGKTVCVVHRKPEYHHWDILSLVHRVVDCCWMNLQNCCSHALATKSLTQQITKYNDYTFVQFLCFFIFIVFVFVVLYVDTFLTFSRFTRSLVFPPQNFKHINCGLLLVRGFRRMLREKLLIRTVCFNSKIKWFYMFRGFILLSKYTHRKQ